MHGKIQWRGIRNKGENNLRGVIIRWPTEQERQRHPKVRKARARRELHEARLYKDRFRHSVLRHGVQDPEVRDAGAGVLRGPVGEDGVEEGEDAELDADGHVVDDAPGDELRDDPGEDAREEYPEEQPGEDDGDRGGAPVRGCEVGGEGDQDLWLKMGFKC